MKKVLYLFLALVVFSPPVISQIQESSWNFVPSPEMQFVNLEKTKAVIKNDLTVFYLCGTPLDYFQADFVKNMWNSYVPTPDSVVVVFKISEYSQIENIKDMAISVPIQDSTWYSSPRDYTIYLKKDWQETKIPYNSMVKNVGKIYMRFVILFKDELPKTVEIIIEVKTIVGLYNDGKKYFFFGSELTDIKDKTIPDKFVLSQNYPNPFNPTTSIRYSIPKSEFVNLKVYDLLGREIVTLVDEEKAVGSYEVNFNASNLPSGTYFYKLQTGNSVETKKMLLLK